MGKVVQRSGTKQIKLFSHTSINNLPVLSSYRLLISRRYTDLAEKIKRNTYHHLLLSEGK